MAQRLGGSNNKAHRPGCHQRQFMGMIRVRTFDQDEAKSYCVMRFSHERLEAGVAAWSGQGLPLPRFRGCLPRWLVELRRRLRNVEMAAAYPRAHPCRRRREETHSLSLSLPRPSDERSQSLVTSSPPEGNALAQHLGTLATSLDLRGLRGLRIRGLEFGHFVLNSLPPMRHKSVA